MNRVAHEGKLNIPPFEGVGIVVGAIVGEVVTWVTVVVGTVVTTVGTGVPGVVGMTDEPGESRLETVVMAFVFTSKSACISS